MIQKPSSCSGCPLYDPPFGKHSGFSTPDGDGTSGVMVIGEALGEHEEREGLPFVGRSGHELFNNLARVGVQRDTLRIFNTIACRPPDNKLVGMSYERACIDHCRPNLDGAIAESRAIAAANGKTFTIVTLGKTAFKRVLNLDDKRDAALLKEDYFCYPFWSPDYQAWVLAAAHPSYLMRGKHHEWPVLTFAFKRALEIATTGLQIGRPPYLLDPEPAVFASWVDDYLATSKAAPDATYLSYDIETPYKRGRAEDQLAKEDADDYSILRCAFAYQPGQAVSVPWTAHYMADIGRLFASKGAKLGWNADIYDRPRVEHNLGSRIAGDHLDGMLAWHVLNSALPKGLGFVTPFYAQDTSMWKHLSAAEPAFYNAKDADMALRIWLGVKEDLKSTNLWGVFDRHVIQLNRIYDYMSQKGVMLDKDLRDAAEVKLTGILEGLEHRIASAVPASVLQLKPYAKPPKDTTGMVQVPGSRKTTKCPACATLDVKAAHYKSIGKKKLGKGEPENPCVGLKSLKVTIPATQWALPLPFKLSNTSLQRYQRVMRHQPILNKERKPTFDDKAITRLMVKYPSDGLYPLIGDFRAVQKLRGTYVGITDPVTGKIRGGMTLGRDGRVHTSFSHNPSTLRSASNDPNMQNLPRPQGPDDNATLIRAMIVASPGHILYARDFSGIEAKIVGYEALYPEYIRLCNLDVHSFYTAWALSQIKPGSIPANDLPQLSWDDGRLKARLKEIKSEFGRERNNLYKHLVHGANFMQGARGATDTILRMTGQIVPVSTVARVMNIYFELFPEIRRWHSRLLAQADRDGFLRNAFGYVHRFHSVYTWEKIGTEWQKEPGPQANQVIAFLPQSNAAGIIKEAMLRIWENHYEEAGQYLRLLVHDELFFEVPEDKWENLDRLCKLEMEKPIKQMKQPLEWGMGEHFVVSTEEKKGPSWALMK